MAKRDIMAEGQRLADAWSKGKPQRDAERKHGDAIASAERAVIEAAKLWARFDGTDHDGERLLDAVRALEMLEGENA